MGSRVVAFWLVFGAIAIGACGGSVIVETTTGGEGGSGASSGVGGDGEQSVCTELCTVGSAFGCDVGGDTCVSSCVEGFAAIPEECKGDYADFLGCISDSIPEAGCDFVDVCQGEVLAFAACAGGSGSGSSGGSP